LSYPNHSSPNQPHNKLNIPAIKQDTPATGLDEQDEIAIYAAVIRHNVNDREFKGYKSDTIYVLDKTSDDIRSKTDPDTRTLADAVQSGIMET